MANASPLLLKDEKLNEYIPLSNVGFAKSFQFSSDGTRSLSATEGNSAIVANVPTTSQFKSRYYSDVDSSHEEHNSGTQYGALLDPVPMGESIYDLKWLPTSSQFFASTCRDHPIALWELDNTNAETTASIRCSYSGYDQADELDPAICLSFNISGDKLYTGANRVIR